MICSEKTKGSLCSSQVLLTNTPGQSFLQKLEVRGPDKERTRLKDVTTPAGTSAKGHSLLPETALATVSPEHARPSPE